MKAFVACFLLSSSALAQPIGRVDQGRGLFDGGSWPMSITGSTTVTSTTIDGGPLKYISVTGAFSDPPWEAAYTSKWQGKTARHIQVLGQRNQGWSSTSTMGDACEYLDTSQALINAVSTSTVYYLRSSNVNDAAAGTGAQSVRIVALDTSGNDWVQTVATNGTTGVFLDAGYLAFQWMEVASVGSGGETALGNLTISTVVGAPTVAQTVEWISLGSNRSRCARYRIPNGYTGYLEVMRASSTGAATMDVRLRGTYFNDNGHQLSSVFHFIGTIFVQASSNAPGIDLTWMSVPAGAILKCSAIPSNAPAANRLDCGFDLLVVQN